MISIDLIRNNPKVVEKMLKFRGSDFDLKNFLAVDLNYRQNLQRLEDINNRRKTLSKDRSEASIERAKKLKQDFTDLNEIVSKLQQQRDELWGHLPNLVDAKVPDGKSDKDNVPIKFCGKKVKFDFEPKWHDELAINLGILDIKAGTKVSGSGFFYWKGDGARLVNAMFRFALDVMHRRGFELLQTPVLAKQNTFFGTGYLPFSSDALYTCNADNLSLIGTSEQTLVAYHQDELIDVEKPIKLTALTPCFRTEAGSYGKQVRGIFRVHQFYKVEQIIFCKPEDSPKCFELATEVEEELMTKLGIPYRIVNVCIGDLGAPASIKYDIEGFFPGFGDYRELTSNSNLLDFQTRRLNITYKTSEGKKAHPHTISATGITERALLCVIENYQQKDGTIKIPDVLVPYMDGQTIISKKGV